MATVQNANFIQYGRRAGKNKLPPVRKDAISSAPDSISRPRDGTIGPMMTAEGTDLRQIKVIPRSEWDRIKGSLYAKDREREEAKQAKLERAQLHAESQEVVKHWTNTIAGQRQRKLLARKLREEKEEEERKKVDLEEAKYQAMKRKEAIEKAKTAQYFQTDRIKSFHGAHLLTEVLKERDAQIELKKQKAAALEGKDSELLKFYRNEYEKGIIEDQMKARERFEARKMNSQALISQITKNKKMLEREKEEDRKEGEEIRKLVKIHEWEQKQLEEVKKKEKMNIMESHKTHVANKDAIRALEKQQDEEENDEIRLFATAKKRMLKLRKEKEKELFKEMMDHKDRMTNLLASQLKQKVDDEDRRIEQAKKEREEKLQEEIKSKEEKLRRDLAGIAAHRNEQLKLKDLRGKQEKEEAFHLLDERMEADRLFAEKQTERQRNVRDNYKKLQDFRMAQINERAELERNARDEDYQHDHQLLDVLALEEKQFQEYANKVISEAKARGRNPYPLMKAAKAGAGGGKGPQFEGKGGVRPSYLTADGYGIELPSCQLSTSDVIKSKCEAGDATVAKKRLGFVW